MKKEGELKIRGKSKRRYPKKKCTNPECEECFIPTDLRQIYCCGQCGIDARNDRRRQLNSTRYKDEKTLKEYDKILEAIHNRIRQLDKKTISLREIELFGITKHTINIETVMADSRKIRWFYFFGLHAANKDFTEFNICKRDKIG
jgi:hypothetical protein